jgi:hypothetical protein
MATEWYLSSAAAFKEFGGDILPGSPSGHQSLWSCRQRIHTLSRCAHYSVSSLVSVSPRLDDSKSPPNIVLSPSRLSYTNHSIFLDPTFLRLRVKSGVAIARLLRVALARRIIVSYGRRQLKLSWTFLHAGIDTGTGPKSKSQV